MAIVFLGLSTCALTGKVIQDGDEFLGFRHFVTNEADPLSVLSDAAVLKDAYDAFPLREEADRWLSLLDERLSEKVCYASGNPVLGWDDFIFTPLFTRNPEDELYELNYRGFSKQGMRGWDRLPHLIGLVRNLQDSGRWKGEQLTYLLKELEAIQ